MGEILPIISEMKNDIIDSTNLDELKSLIRIRYKQLFAAFSRAGIQIQAHERGQEIALNERINGSAKPTTDPTLNQKVACSNKMGCVIKGEEDNPILEDIEIYFFKEENALSLSPQGVVENEPVIANEEKTSHFNENVGSHQPEGVSPQNNDSSKKVEAIIHNEGKYVRFENNVLLKMKQSSQTLCLIPRESSIILNLTKIRLIPSVQDSCSIYLGTQLLSREFSLENGELLYCVKYNKKKNFLQLVFTNGKTKKQLVQHQLNFMIK